MIVEGELALVAVLVKHQALYCFALQSVALE